MIDKDDKWPWYWGGDAHSRPERTKAVIAEILAMTARWKEHTRILEGTIPAATMQAYFRRP